MIAHGRGFDPTRTETIIAALKILSRDIQSGDGVANAALLEAAEHMQWLSDLLTRPPVDLRKAAEGQPCILCGSVGTTVLHHVRSGG